MHKFASTYRSKPECVGSFNMDWRVLVFYPEPEARDKIYLLYQMDNSLVC